MRFIQGAVIAHHKPEIEQDLWISGFLYWHPTAQLRRQLGRGMQELPQENVPLQVSGLWACPANSGLASPHYHVSQLFKIKPSQARFSSTYTKINPSLLFASPLLTSPLEKLLYLRGLQRGLGPETPGLKKNMSEMWGPICED